MLSSTLPPISSQGAALDTAAAVMRHSTDTPSVMKCEHTASIQIDKLGAEWPRGLGAGLEEATQAAERAIGSL